MPYQNIVNYYRGWPHKGPYVDILNKIRNDLFIYLQNFPKHEKWTVIFDIDDTLVYTNPINIHNEKDYKVRNPENLMVFKGIEQIVDVAKLCKELGFYIIIITARPCESELSSKKNLKYLGINYDEIYHNDKYPDSSFKINLKAKLVKKHNIILSIGDNLNDLKNLKNCLCIKLPDPSNPNAYFTFDNQRYYLI
jgi:predicted secreted acid phosphatase